MKKTGFLKIVLIILLVIIVAIIVGVRFALTPVAFNIVNDQLAEQLSAGGKLGGLELALTQGRITANNLRIEQPVAGHDKPFLTMDKFSVKIQLSSLKTEEWVIEEMTLDGAEIMISRDKDGKVNAALLTPPPETKLPEETIPTDGNKNGEVGSGKEPPHPIRINAVTIRNVTLHYLDASFEEDIPLSLTLKNITFDSSDIQLFSKKMKPDMPIQFKLRIDIDQGDQPDARIGIRAKVDTLGIEIPAMNAVLQLSGLLLTTLDPLVPAGSSQALGGKEVNSHVQASISPTTLEIKGETQTAGAHYELMVGGTPEKPEVEKSGLIFAMMTRGFGSTFNLVGNIGDAGLETVETAAETSREVVEGAAEMVGSVGKGLYGVAKGVVTLDMQETGKGLKQTTLGTVGELAEGIKETSGELAEGLKEVSESSTGADDAKGWSNEQITRWEKNWQDSIAELTAMPYPEIKADTENDTSVDN